MSRYDDLEIRSEEVQEILGTPPGWIVRFGTIVAVVTVGVLIAVGALVRYPDTIVVDIKVSSTDPPKKLIAEEGTYITHILVDNEDTVQAGQTLLVFEPKANFEDILTLENYLLNVEKLNDSFLLAFNPPGDLLLGEIQEDLYEFLEKQEALRISRTKRLENLSVRQLDRQIERAKRTIRQKKREKAEIQKQLNLANQQFGREQNLLNENLITPDRLRHTQEEILAYERKLQGIESTIKNKQFEIEMMENEINGAERSGSRSGSNASLELKDSFINLQFKLENWKKRFLVVSPIAGIVLFTNENIGEKQYVRAESELIKVVPVNQKALKGKIDLNLSGSGKVKEGQRVVVKFKSYPFPEFGAVIGKVSRKGKVPIDGKIPIEVTFPEGLKTTTGRIIETGREMPGKAEIIMDRKRFITRIFEKVRGAVS